MDGTLRLMARVERFGPGAGIVGGLLFFAWWTTRSRNVGLPTGPALLLDVTTMLLVTVPVLAHTLHHGSHPSAWLGWAGTAAVALGFGGSPPMLCAGLALFGLSVVRCEVHPRTPGLLLMTGAGMLMTAWAWAPGFGRVHSAPLGAWNAVTGVALVLIAAALADLDAIDRENRAPA